jgi:large subunit ribosomal protein L25
MEQEGAVLNHPQAMLTIKCAANNIPDQIIVDVSKLTLEDTLTVADLMLPEGVVAADDPETLIAQIQIQEELPEEEEAEPAEGEPEVIGREEGEGEEESEEA